MKNKWKDKQEFKNEVIKIADKLGLRVGVIYVCHMINKWASITSDARRIYFDSKLLEIDKEVGRYVIYHELVHIRVPNHGKLFKSMIRLYCKNHELLAKKLTLLT